MSGYPNTLDVIVAFASKDGSGENAAVAFFKKFWKLLEKLPSMCNVLFHVIAILIDPFGEKFAKIVFLNH